MPGHYGLASRFSQPPRAGGLRPFDPGAGPPGIPGVTPPGRGLPEVDEQGNPIAGPNRRARRLGTGRGLPEVDEQGNPIAGPNRRARRLGGTGGTPRGGSGLSSRTRSLSDLRANYPGFNPTPVTHKPRDPSGTLAQVVRRDQARFDFFNRPVQQDVIGSLNDSTIVDDARREANDGFVKANSRSLRQQRRFGLQRSAVQQREFNRASGRERSLNQNATVNEARIEQKERNDGLRRELINIGRGVASDATDNLGESAALQSQREANNRNAKAAKKAQNTQTAAAVGSAVLTAILSYYV